MLKKLFVTAAAAAAVSVPLAGAAWADPADPPSDQSSNAADGNGIGQGGVPEKAGAFLDNFNLNPNGYGNPAPPGSVFKVYAQVPGSNTPDTYGDALNGFWHGQGQYTDTDFNPTPPGMASKAFTPACRSGRTGGGVGTCA
ncbi:MAG: hypothetical protein QOI29_4477 [Mycobacterium sp.]|jgi:opacity protein-like surface antigen|nr:hypothetical protein [Mycobacterium sp.]MDT5347628.1 hypothetical protein [Mycobacterium sp.]